MGCCSSKDASDGIQRLRLSFKSRKHQAQGPFSSQYGSKPLYLYYTTYLRGGRNRKIPHSALVLAPAFELETPETLGIRYHVRDFPGPKGSIWEYEVRKVRAMFTNMLLCRILIAEITDAEHLRHVLDSIPVTQGDPKWRCRHWVRAALQALHQDSRCIGESIDLNDWDSLWNFTLEYVKNKAESGRFQADTIGSFEDRTRPTYNLIHGVEFLP
jgi:hypothetical protein